MNSQTYLTVKDLCARYSLSKSGLYAMIRRNEFPKPEKFGRRTARWRVVEVEALDAARAARVADGTYAVAAA